MDDETITDAVGALPRWPASSARLPGAFTGSPGGPFWGASAAWVSGTMMLLMIWLGMTATASPVLVPAAPGMSREEAAAVIARTRQWVQGFLESLPNFTCRKNMRVFVVPAMRKPELSDWAVEIPKWVISSRGGKPRIDESVCLVRTVRRGRESYEWIEWWRHLRTPPESFAGALVRLHRLWGASRCRRMGETGRKQRCSPSRFMNSTPTTPFSQRASPSPLW